MRRLNKAKILKGPGRDGTAPRMMFVSGVQTLPFANNGHQSLQKRPKPNQSVRERETVTTCVAASPPET